MALFKTIAELQAVIPINNTTDLAQILPDIEWAEKKYIIPLISQAQYDALNTAYQAGTMSAQQTALLPYVQMALAHFAYAKNVLVAQLHIDNNGVSIVSTEMRKTAFAWQIESLTEDYCAEKAFDGADFMLAFMETNKANYPLWTASTSYTETKQFFINNTADFQKFVDINNSRLSFISMWQIMRSVEELNLVAELGEDFYDDLKAKILGGTTSTTENTLINKYIKPVVAFLVSAEVVSQLPIRFKHGALAVDYVAAAGSNEKERKRPDSVFMSNYAETQKNKAGNYMGRMLDYLNNTASASVFALFYASDLYVGPDERVTTFQNSDRSNYLM